MKVKYAGLKLNDIVNGNGVCVSFWVQGCPFHCKNCQNPETWDEYGGKEIEFDDLIKKIILGMDKNNVKRNFSILGGEPLMPINRKLTHDLIHKVRCIYPEREIFLWTGYLYENLVNENDPLLENIFRDIDYLIDGQYEDENRDIRLKWRGSPNQKVYRFTESGIYTLM